MIHVANVKGIIGNRFEASARKSNIREINAFKRALKIVLLYSRNGLDLIGDSLFAFKMEPVHGPSK